MSQHTYNITDYNKLHQYVIKYQQGDTNSADNIIESFNGFIWKFVNLITRGCYQVSDQSIRRFIGLYVTQPYVKKYYSHYNYKPIIKIEIEDSVKMICSLFAQYSADEIRNELICVLLNMAKKYKDYEKPSFHNYVDKCYHFEAYRGLSHLISDPITRLSYEEFIDNMAVDPAAENEFELTLEEVCQDMAIQNATIPVVHEKVSPFDKSSLNTNWVNGVTCSDLFQELTPFERKIIALHYMEHLTDTEIAEQVGLCRATINRRRLKAKEKLSSVVKTDNVTEVEKAV